MGEETFAALLEKAPRREGGQRFRNTCAEILHLRYGGRSEDDPDLVECLGGLPFEVTQLFEKREQESSRQMERVDKDRADDAGKGTHELEEEEQEEVQAISSISQKPRHSPEVTLI
jgi:hypothetical protein